MLPAAPASHGIGASEDEFLATDKLCVEYNLTIGYTESSCLASHTLHSEQNLSAILDTQCTASGALAAVRLESAT